jgi:hypothetical protein
LVVAIYPPDTSNKSFKNSRKTGLPERPFYGFCFANEKRPAAGVGIRAI